MPTPHIILLGAWMTHDEIKISHAVDAQVSVRVLVTSLFPVCVGVARPGRSLEWCMESARAPGVCVTLLCSSVGRAGVASGLDPVLNTRTAAKTREPGPAVLVWRAASRRSGVDGARQRLAASDRGD